MNRQYFVAAFNTVRPNPSDFLMKSIAFRLRKNTYAAIRWLKELSNDNHHGHCASIEAPASTIDDVPSVISSTVVEGIMKTEERLSE